MRECKVFSPTKRIYEIWYAHLTFLRRQCLKGKYLSGFIYFFLTHTILEKFFFNSIMKVKLSWCPLVRMFWSKTSGNAINKINERLLGIALCNNIDSFAELLPIMT